ncbi:MAG: hypothetical protein AAFU73_12585 [Planctomycetota bacterium]
MHPSKPLSIALALSLTGTAAAQIDTGGFIIYGNPMDRVYEFPLIEAATTDVASGEVTNDLIPDVVAVMDGMAVLIVGPSYANIQFELPLPSGHTEAFACSTFNIESNRYADAIASTELGLVRWVRDNATGNYSPVAVSGTSQWAKAKQLMVANVFPGAESEIMGLFLDANGNSIVRAGTISTSGFTELAAGSIPATAISIHATDRDTASPQDEVAILFSTAVFYLRSQGALLTSFDVDFFMDNALCAASISDSRGDGLAVVHDMGPVGSELGVYRASGPAEPRVFLTADTVTEIAAGEAAGGPGDDLVIVAKEVDTWRNISDGSGASFTHYPVFPSAEFNGVANSGLTGLLLMDFDNDGDVDIYVERESGTDTAIAHLNRRVSQIATSPLVQLPPAGQTGDETQNVATQPGTASGNAIASLHMYNMPAVQTSGMTHVLVELWLPGREPTLERLILPVPGSQSQAFDMEFPIAGLNFTPNDYGTFICRGVTLDAGGIPVTAGPAQRFGFPMTEIYTSLRTNSIGLNPPDDDPPPPGGGWTGTPGSGSPPGF